LLSAESDIDSLEGYNLDSRLTTAESNITTAEGDIVTLDGRLDTYDGYDLDNRVGDLETVDTGYGNRITALETSIDGGTP